MMQANIPKSQLLPLSTLCEALLSSAQHGTVWIGLRHVQGGLRVPLQPATDVHSQVLAVLSGGRLALHGQPVTKRWTRLAAPAVAGDNTIIIISGADLAAGWTVGKEVLITSSTFNPDQAETRRILAVNRWSLPDQLQLQLDAPLAWNHTGGEYR